MAFFITNRNRKPGYIYPQRGIESGFFHLKKWGLVFMENVTVTKEQLAQQEQEGESLAQKRSKANTKISSIIGKAKGKNRFSEQEPDEQQPEEGQEEQEASPQEGAEEQAEPEEEPESTTETEQGQVPEYISSAFSQAYPDEELDSSEAINEKISGLIDDSKNLAAEREANQKVYDIFENSEEMVQIARSMDKGHSFLESLALTVDIDQTLSDLKEEDPQKYKQVVKAQAKREAEQERMKEEQENLQQEFKENEEASEQAITNFKDKKSLSDSDSDQFLNKIDGYFSDLVKGKITSEFLDVVYRGLNYDSNLEKAKQQAKIEGKNEKINAERSKKKGDGMPSLKNGKTKSTKTAKPAKSKKALSRIVTNSRSTFG